MRKLLPVGAMVACLSLVSVSTASAAKEVGEPCIANGAEANRTALVFTGASNPLMQPVVPEEPPQVITAWKVQVAPGTAPLAQRLEVYRVLNEAQDYRKEAEGATETVHEGLNVFPTRIPVKSWTGYLGLYGPGGALVCNSTPGVAGFFEGSAALGETRNIKSAINQGVPLMATVEDDRDGDGYGDETQDKCPQSAAIQSACPPVSLGTEALVREKTVVILVTTSTEAPVAVSGEIKAPRATAGSHGKVPRGPKREPGPRIDSNLDAGKQTVAPGQIAHFRLSFSERTRDALSRLPRKRSLRLDVTVTGTALDGSATTSRLAVKLRGQARHHRRQP